MARKVKKGKKNFPFLKLIIPIAFIVIVVLFMKLSTRFWNGTDKVPVVYKEVSGDIAVTILDPGLSEITTLVIPGDTEVDVARNYGTFRIKNVWQLGVNEKIGGNLLSETVTQNFLFPTILWDGRETGLDSGSFAKLVSFVFTPGSTNVPLGDRIQMALFSLRMQDMGRSTIDLGKSQFLDKKILNDGQPGYEITGPVSQRLTVYFSDNNLGNQNIRVNITDLTGSPGVSEKLGEILQVIGGKVVSIDKKTSPEASDCVITGGNDEAVKKIASLFSCKIGNSRSSFDLDIKIGEEFAKRF